ncbi:hypothetical protein AB1283_00785 [Bacillus sp. S13(2024)]|uniref:hypothetical protein n=1 Tax=Bacillus sp. S13(2024) TaxID=3162885 RepID=UPI003D1CCA60
MKFPIGFTFIQGFLTYEVIEYNPQSQTPYKLRFGISPNDEDCDIIEMTEGELEVSSNLGI